MIKAVLFDLDGTLTDSDKVHFQVFQKIFATHGIQLDTALYKQKVSGRQNAAIMADFFPDLPASDAEAFSAHKESVFRQQAKGCLTPMPGLTALLSQLKAKGLATAVVTNAPPENAGFMLETLGLSQAFDPVVIADHLPRGKPDPLPYQTALNQLGIAPTEALVFEDSIAGIRSAVGAGIVTIGLTTTHEATELMQVGASRAIADFTDAAIPALLQV